MAPLPGAISSGPARPGTSDRLPPVLHRTAFSTSRMMEFFTEKELRMQLGMDRWHWPVALAKELIDNALDACEVAGVAPQITVTVTDHTLAVADNGAGLPHAVLDRSLDYLVRVSDKAYYISPTRGQLGNALKAVWAAPFVVSGTEGRIDVQTAAYALTVRVHLDRIAQKPMMTVEPLADGIVQNGTTITLHWPGIASEIAELEDVCLYNSEGAGSLSLQALLEGYVAVNPHLSLAFLHGEASWSWVASDLQWPKWSPNALLVPHWYTAPQLRDLLAAYLTHAREAGQRCFVREIVAKFAGLKRSDAGAAVLQQAGLPRATLEDLVLQSGMDDAAIARLLQAMQARSRVIQPKALGVLGKAHLEQCLMRWREAAPDTLTYHAQLSTSAEGWPYVLEVACGWSTTTHRPGRHLTGLNWTPSLRVPFASWRSLVSQYRIDSHDPLSLVVHLACPVVPVTDRAKSQVALPQDITAALSATLGRVTKRWQRLKRDADKHNRVTAQAIKDEAKRQRQQQISIKEAAWQVMEEAYLKASDHGRLPANARQIMYAARPLVIALRDPAPIWKQDSQFTQGYLPDFLAAYPELTREWDVVYDDRGHFAEPHTRRSLGLGTLKVRRYRYGWDDPCLTTPDGTEWGLDAVETSGPLCRYKYVLFLEKEGFDELLAAGEIAERYDLAIMSTKGQTVTAARTLVEALSQQGVTFLLVHDFDKAGIEIADKFTTDTRRFHYSTKTNVIDLGLRLADVEAMGLASEPVEYGDDKDPRVNLRRCGATEAEVGLLRGTPGLL